MRISFHFYPKEFSAVFRMEIFRIYFCKETGRTPSWVIFTGLM